MTRSSFLTVFQGVVMLVALASSTRVQARTVSIDFMQGQNATVKGVYVTKEFWFELSEDWEFPQPAALELRFSHTPILVRQLSTLSVQVNGSAVDSIYLDNTNLRNAVLNLPIPGRFLKGGMNVLTLVIKMRSELKDLCDDVHNPALWTLLERESRLVVNYNEKEIKPDLQGFPQDYANPDLLYTEEKERVHAVVLTSASPSQAEMELVGALAVALGQGIGVGSGEFRVVPIDQADPADVRSRQVIVAGGPDVVKRATGGPWKVPAPIGELAQEPGGVLMEFASPLNPYRRLLVATGRDDAALRLLASHLRTPASLGALKGPSAVFDKAPYFEIPPVEQEEAAFLVRLKDLKMSDLLARGKFYHSISFTLPNPFVGKVKDGAFLRLSMSHSEVLLPQSSSLLLRVNGEPVRSLRLSRETAARNTWDIKIPIEYLNTRFLTFELELFLDIGDPDCYYNHPEMAWFSLHNDTLLYLPVDSASGETLANYPYMLLRWNRFNRLAVVLAGTPTPGILTAAFNVVAYLSQSLRSPNFVDLFFGPFQALSPEQRAQWNLILVGPMGQLQGQPELASLLPPEMVNREPQGREDLWKTAGFLSLVRRPEGQRVLAVTGSGDRELLRASAHLYQTGKVEWVRGTLAAVLDPDELKVLLPPPEQDAVQRFDPAKVRFEDREGRLVPVLEVPQPASVAPRYNMAYLVFFVLTPVLILLIVLRLRALSKEGKEDKV